MSDGVCYGVCYGVSDGVSDGVQGTVSGLSGRHGESVRMSQLLVNLFVGEYFSPQTVN